MQRLKNVEPELATGKVKELLDAVSQRLGMVPNMMRTMANAPAVLDGYLQLSGSLSPGTLPAKVREQIAIAVAQANNNLRRGPPPFGLAHSHNSNAEITKHRGQFFLRRLN